MCILFIAIGQHPDYPLIVAANRDEYHDRPSQALHAWTDHGGIVAGRDLQAGGTWLGINQNRQFAAVTNFRNVNPLNPKALSRGDLVVKALSEPEQNTEHSDQRQEFDHYIDLNHQRYNPFNLVYGDVLGIQAWDFKGGARRRLSPGFHSISNGPIDDQWPKMAHGVTEIGKLISRQSDLDPAKISEIMLDQTRAPDNQLPATGVAAEQEQMLSSIFVKGERYGTRTTTILLFGSDKILVKETNYSADAMISSAHELTVPR